MPDKYCYFYGSPLSRKTRKTNTEVTSVVLLDLRQYYEKSSLAVFLSFVYLSSTLWGTPTAKVHDTVPWSDTIKCHAKRWLFCAIGHCIKLIHTNAILPSFLFRVRYACCQGPVPWISYLQHTMFTSQNIICMLLIHY
jgi:hypothetical protein